jgi:type IV pilus assembly protein PilX
MHRATTSRVNAIGGRRQGGVVLLIALIVLVAMTLAGIGMMRSIDAGTLVAGNIGFREAAVATADTGVEAARAWLVANINRLCAIPGTINGVGQTCAYSVQNQTGSTQSSPDYSSFGLSTALAAYYRITVRVNGPKNTVSYVQALLLI